MLLLNARAFSLMVALATALLATPSNASDDPRAADSLSVFSGMCVNTFLNKPTAVDEKTFRFTELSEKLKKRIKPDLKPQKIWDVYARASEASMLLRYDPSGMCVVEIAEADEISVQEAFASMASKTAANFGSTAIPQPTQNRKLDNQNATNMSWRIKTPQEKDILLMLTTYPTAKFMVQHVLTVSYVQ